MKLNIRAAISTQNKYYIDKHRHYELKHFCLQYPEWKRAYASFENDLIPAAAIDWVATSNLPGDPTAKRATLKAHYAEKIDLIERAAREADKYISDYILKAATEGLSYTYLKTRWNIPCGKDMFYDRYRKFFWILNELRN